MNFGFTPHLGDLFPRGNRARALLAVSAVLGLTMIACPPPPEPPPEVPPAQPPPPGVTPPPVTPVTPEPTPIMLRGDVAVTANEGGETLYIVDVAEGMVAGAIGMERPVHRVAVAPGARLAIASDSSPDSNRIVAADLVNMRKLGELDVGSQPRGLAIDERQARVYVANSGDDTITILQARVEETTPVTPQPGEPQPGLGAQVTPTPVEVLEVLAETIEVGSEPNDLAIVRLQGQTRLYVTNEGDGTVSVVDTDTLTVVETVEVGQGPTRIAVLPDNGEPRPGLAPAPQQPGAQVTPGETPEPDVTPIATPPPRPTLAVYVLNAMDGTVSVIDATANVVVATIEVGDNLTGLAVTQDGRFLYVSADDPDSNLFRVNLADYTVEEAFDIGAGALAVATAIEAEVILVTTTDDQLVIFDTQTKQVQETLDVGEGPVDVDVGNVRDQMQVTPEPAATPPATGNGGTP